MRARALAAGALLLSLVPCVAQGAATRAPLGQSILLHWVEATKVYVEGVVNPRKDPYRDVTLSGDARVYLSGKGRPFGETSVFGGGGRGFGRNGNGLHQQAPEDDGDDPAGGVLPWHWTLSGNVLAGTQVLVHGARQAQVVFTGDGSAWQCRLQVILGKSEGEIVRYGRKQKPVHVLSSAISDEQCSVVPGNVFAP